MKQRILQYLELKDISKAEFERQSGLSNGYINNIKGNLGASKVENILRAFPDINRIWLLTGEGPMLSGESAEEEAEAPRVSYTTGRPYYNVDFIGGFDLVLNDQTVTPEYNIDFGPYNKEGVLWCNITGRSMEPQISHGDIIAIREVRDWQSYLNYGEVYALVTANDMRTVKVVRKGADSETFRLVPHNTAEYDEQEIPKRMVLRVFEVIGCMKKI